MGIPTTDAGADVECPYPCDNLYTPVTFPSYLNAARFAPRHTKSLYRYPRICPKHTLCLEPKSFPSRPNTSTREYNMYIDISPYTHV